MKIRFFYLCLFMGVLLFTSCDESDDINKLQEQIDDLGNKVDELEKAQQEALLSQIAELKALIVELQGQNSEMSSNYDKMLANLADLQGLIEEASKEDVFYGNVISDDDFVKLAASDAIIVTGKVSANNQAHIDALNKVKLIGGYLEVTGGTDLIFPSLENIGGDLLITEISEVESTVSMPMLATIGGDLSIGSTKLLKSFSADKLVMVYDNIEISNNEVLQTVSLPALDEVGSLFVNGAIVQDGFENRSELSIDLSMTNVKRSVDVSFLSNGSKLELGELGGSFKAFNNGFTTLEITTTQIPGNFEFVYNGEVEEIKMINLNRIGGNVNIISNTNNGYGGATKGLATLECFDNVEYIGGDLIVRGNSVMEEIDAFNKVKEFKGASIIFDGNGSAKTYMNVFTALESAGIDEWTKTNIMIAETTEWFIGFSNLTAANNIELLFSKLTIEENGVWQKGDICKFEGFEKLTSVTKLNLSFYDVTEFSGFNVLSDFTYFNEYLTISLPQDESVGFCTMEPILTKIKNGELDSEWNPNKQAIFNLDYVQMDRDAAIERLLSSCSN